MGHKRGSRREGNLRRALIHGDLYLGVASDSFALLRHSSLSLHQPLSIMEPSPICKRDLRELTESLRGANKKLKKTKEAFPPHENFEELDKAVQKTEAWCEKTGQKIKDMQQQQLKNKKKMQEVFPPGENFEKLDEAGQKVKGMQEKLKEKRRDLRTIKARIAKKHEARKSAETLIATFLEQMETRGLDGLPYKDIANSGLWTEVKKLKAFKIPAADDIMTRFLQIGANSKSLSCFQF